ncbi:unnamed protein product [Acanthoscelides obtectus]|uniref:Uncharacterized protein n=1 Tax=Acanthoscelides obtectus TaxID=200917 RepID=A0A9P0LRE6_ACAOB|nr:unnamed protein product [Acanthoscelides obtectus]CAK1657264.1 hypothetical protein AOBTE_LOCUS20257 [Acanthoscelides obtectus]
MEEATVAPRTSDIPKNGLLRKCFLSLVDRKILYLEIEELNTILNNELMMNTKNLDSDLTDVLPYILCYYIKHWPGWQRSKEYFSGKLHFKDWYDKFKQYIVLKMNYAIRNAYPAAMKMESEEMKAKLEKCITRGSQTDYLSTKGTSPCSIVINCSSNAVNTLVFTDSEDNIVIKKHPPLKWPDIHLRDLVNWPYVTVKFISPEFSFERKNCGTFQRYLAFANMQFPSFKQDYIEEVSIIDENSPRFCYTAKLLGKYVTEYINVLETVGEATRAEINIIAILFDEFLKDIEEMGMNNTMASNSSVVFNIGRNHYSRTKKITKGNTAMTGMKAEVNYCEMFIPKMATSLFYFTPFQDTKANDVSFVYLNEFKNNVRTDVQELFPKVNYKCEFCNIQHTTPMNMLAHLTQMHSMEPNFICPKCTKPLRVPNLVHSRWKHECTGK